MRRTVSDVSVATKLQLRKCFGVRFSMAVVEKQRAVKAKPEKYLSSVRIIPKFLRTSLFLFRNIQVFLSQSRFSLITRSFECEIAS